MRKRTYWANFRRSLNNAWLCLLGGVIGEDFVLRVALGVALNSVAANQDLTMSELKDLLRSAVEEARQTSTSSRKSA